MGKILLFVPFYNCEKQIIRVLEQVKKYQYLFSETLLVDNRSSDQGLHCALDFIAKEDLRTITVVRNTQNYNLGGSHKVAFEYAVRKGYDFLVVLHGDDQGRIADLVPLIEEGEHYKYDCLLGARFHPQSQLKGYSRFRTFGNIVLNYFCSLATRQKVIDMGSGLNMYKKEFINDKAILNFPNDLTFNVFLLFHSCFGHKKIKFFPIVWREEDQISNAKLLSQFKIIMGLVLRTLISPAYMYRAKNHQDYSYEVITQK